ncbi:TPA: helix-turn-helix domain-containing protein [Legionella pneumophila]|nr:helix-turn-helix domain-containing protein [Legionella pneumophila]HAU0297824.1 helix-turn-helix domain-containing protein [Legionella pneumophila]
MGLHMNTLNIEEASKFLGAHRETIRRMAASGELPGVKIGRSWVFIEQDLVMYMRNKYSSDASQGVHNNRSSKIWHSTKEKVSGGLIFSTKEKEYAKVLGLK